MCIKKVFLIKTDVPDNAKPVCEDAEFKGITEMPVDVHLLDGRVSGGMWRHGTIGSFIRGIGIIQTIGFFKGFELPDDTVGILGVVLCNPCFNSGGVKEQHGGFLLINTLADRFGQINKMVEHRL